MTEPTAGVIADPLARATRSVSVIYPSQENLVLRRLCAMLFQQMALDGEGEGANVLSFSSDFFFFPFFVAAKV